MKTFKKFLVLMLMLGNPGWLSLAQAAPLAISENPLFLTANVPPNVIVTLDDSGSMSRAFTPDLCGNGNNICGSNPDPSLDPRYVKSSHYNPIYYNPAVTYTPPVDADGNALTTSFDNAWVNGYAHSLDVISPDSYNLASQYRPTAGLFLRPNSGSSYSDDKYHQFMRHYSSDVRCQASACQYNSNVGKGSAIWVNMGGGSCSSNATCQSRQMPAYYYVFDETNSGCDGLNESGDDVGKKLDNACYDIQIVGASEQQNFANWYSFYRTRNLATIAAASLAFAEFDPSTRIAWQALNTCRGSTTSLTTSGCTGWSGNLGFSNAIKPFSGTHRENFYTWLFRLNTNTSTPLREAMVRAGEYYETTGENSPYDDDLTASGSTQLSCRKNFHILMTDGIWNDSTPSGISNEDGGLASPYKDTNTASLADVAYKYWASDLTGLTDNLLPYIVEPDGDPTLQYNNPRNDPATWQHMVNFTVGLGLTPFLDYVNLTYSGSTYTGSYGSLFTGAKQWPDLYATDPDSTKQQQKRDGARVADLWHAAINSRGQFFSADTSEALVSAFKAVKDAIEIATPSAAALAANSTSIQTGALVYQATFNSKDWSGDLIAYEVGLDGLVNTSNPAWNAASKMPSPADRKIWTYDGSDDGALFEWDSLNPAQKSLLNTDATGTVDTKGSLRLDWLRGVQTQEVKNGGTFRNRSSVLGDIINSDPAFAHQDDFGYASMGAAEASLYAAYVADKSDRKAAVFVGGNDGMLHVFRADAGKTESGREFFAYVPEGVFANLSKLTDPAYTHKYYVDGGPTVGDAYLSSGWATVLVGGLGGGGKSVYALDVSDVENPSDSMVLWEYTEADLGLTYSKPQIARLNNGQWAAIFGNGYNSANERAYLYVVNIETGEQIAKIEAGSSTSNGLSTPVLHDANGDMIADYAYAGDLQGNLWKFDLTAMADETVPLFTARNASDQVQPITGQPVIGGHPDGGVLVYFGTGRYLEAADPLVTQVQSFYGIWDNGSSIATTNRSELQVQSIVAETSETFILDVKDPDDPDDDVTQTFASRETSANTVDWGTKRGWYMDMNYPAANGERIVTQALLRYGRVIFLTLIPSSNTCDAGGESWLMELDAVTGSKTADSSFDFNNDGKFDDGDFLASGAVASGVKTSVGITKPPAWFTGTGGKDYKVMTGTTGGIESLGNKGAPPGPSGPGTLRRTYWMQIQ
ncbi:MAG: PilC/PilY family type IV pilus protein [Pseudomonadota bacterium]